MNESRRFFLLSATAGLAGAASLAFAPALAGAALPLQSPTEALRAVASARPALNYHTAGPEDGRPIVLVRVHGQSLNAFTEVASLLAAQGFQVLLPQLRETEPHKLGQELINFIDALHMPEAVFVGIGDASDAAQATLQVRRTRVIGLVAHLAASATPQQIAEAAAIVARQGKWRT